jgi:hypothetical protein
MAMALSISSVVALQTGLPVTNNQRRGRAFTTTQSRVVTNPNNLVQIEKRRNVVDRVALEELYMLSIAADTEIGGTSQPKKRKGNNKKSSATRKATAGDGRVPRKRSFPSPSLLRAAQSDSRSDTATPKLQQQQKQQQPLQPSKPTLEEVSPSASFVGLTTGPNRRNQRLKSLSTVSPIERNPSLFQQSKEAGTKAIKSMESASTSAVSSLTTPVTKSRSSTMPGFQNRGDTLRQKAYRDGIKMAEQSSGRKFVESEQAKKRRRQINGEKMYKTSASVPDSLVQFASEIHGIDRITPKEEVELGEKTQEAIKMQKIYDGLVTKLHREPTDDEWCAAAGKINMEAMVQVIEEGLEAKNKLVTSNLRMVQGVVNVYIRNGLQGQYNAGDLMQEGIMVSICVRVVPCHWRRLWQLLQSHPLRFLLFLRL